MTEPELTRLVMIRHGPTQWNVDRRLQGRSDQPLSAQGRAAVRSWRLADDWHGFRWVTSPLARARQTAALLGHREAEPMDALVETDWGDWEGWRLADLRARLGEAMISLEARGLDFRPPGGESPRDVQARIKPWLRRIADDRRPTVAVCHRGVIRALYALAAGWDMTGDPPGKFLHGTAQIFLVNAAGEARVDRLDLPLVAVP